LEELLLHFSFHLHLRLLHLIFSLEQVGLLHPLDLNGSHFDHLFCLPPSTGVSAAAVKDIINGI